MGSRIWSRATDARGPLPMGKGLVVLATPSTSHPSPAVPLRPRRLGHGLVTDSHAAVQRASTAPHLWSHARGHFMTCQRSDIREEVSLVDVVRPRHSTMNPASSAPADPGPL